MSKVIFKKQFFRRFAILTRHMKKIISSPTTLLDVMQQECPGCSKNDVRSWLRGGRITIDGNLAKTLDIHLKEGMCVALGPRAKFASHGIKILYEDRDLIVIEKPSGLLSVATAQIKEHCVHAILKSRFHTRRVFPVHRLDQDTSGILVFAYTERTRDHLKKQFEAHTIEREYCAVVQGVPSPFQGTWTSYLIEGKDYFVRTSKKNQGQLAITHYKIEKASKTCALLRLTLETGRKNQIRVQAKEAGCPLLGDEKYNPSLDQGKQRLCLHALRLAFTHPTTKKTMVFTSPPPAFFEKLVIVKNLV